MDADDDDADRDADERGAGDERRADGGHVARSAAPVDDPIDGQPGRRPGVQRAHGDRRELPDAAQRVGPVDRMTNPADVRQPVGQAVDVQSGETEREQRGGVARRRDAGERAAPATQHGDGQEVADRADDEDDWRQVDLDAIEDDVLERCDPVVDERRRRCAAARRRCILQLLFTRR